MLELNASAAFTLELWDEVGVKLWDLVIREDHVWFRTPVASYFRNS